MKPDTLTDNFLELMEMTPMEAARDPVYATMLKLYLVIDELGLPMERTAPIGAAVIELAQAVGPVWATGVNVGFEQDAGMNQLLSGRFADGDQITELLAFLSSQGDQVLLHRNLMCNFS